MNDAAAFWRATATGWQRVDADLHEEPIDTVAERHATTSFRAWLDLRLLAVLGRIERGQAEQIFDLTWQRIYALPRHALIVRVTDGIRGVLPAELHSENILVIQAEPSPDAPSLIFHRLEHWSQMQRALAGDLR